MADRPEGRFDRVAGPDTLPVLGRKIKEGHEVLPVLVQTHRCLRVLRFIGLEEQLEGFLSTG